MKRLADCEHPKCEPCTKSRKQYIADLEAENARLGSIEAGGAHSCNPTCQRPMCVMRRDIENVEKENSRLRRSITRLRRALTEIRDQRFNISLLYRCDTLRGIAREALKEDLSRRRERKPRHHDTRG